MFCTIFNFQTRSSVFEKGFLQDVRHNLWDIVPR